MSYIDNKTEVLLQRKKKQISEFLPVKGELVLKEIKIME